MSVKEKMTAIADAIRAKTGNTQALTLEDMAREIAGIQGGGSGVPLISASASGSLKPVHRGVAYTQTELNFTSGATGALQEE